MLKNDFYTVINQIADTGKITAVIRFDAAHRIFEGHFPGQPVVPGVCMMLLVKEILSAGMNEKFYIRKAAQVKFLNMIDPRQHPEVDLQIQMTDADNDSINIDAVLKMETTVFFRMKAEMNRSVE